MYLACLLATLAALPQDPPHEPTMLERIDALIAKTNGYEHFVARYRIRTEDGKEGEMRLMFRSPDEARVVFDMDGGHSDNYVHGDTMVMRASGKAMGAHTATITNARAEVSSVALVLGKLRDAFPKEFRDDQSLRDTRLNFSFDVDTNGRRLDFDAGFGGPACLMWLVQLRARLDKLSSPTDDHATIVYSPLEGVRVVISAQTGLITRVERESKDGAHVGLELTSFDPDLQLGATDMEPSPAGPEARDDSEQVAADFARKGFQRARARVYHEVAGMLDEGRLEWSDAAADKIGGVLRALAASEILPMSQPTVTRCVARLGELKVQVAEELGTPAPQEPDHVRSIRDMLAQSREQLEQSVSKGVESLYEPAYPRGKCKARPSLPDDLDAVERRVLPEVWAEQITKKLLDAFDEMVAKQLEAK